jgi:hypothetical protein
MPHATCNTQLATDGWQAENQNLRVAAAACCVLRLST